MSTILHWIFPKKHRYFNGLRWIRITLRTLHIIGVVGLGGGILFDIPPQHWHSYLYLVTFTGFGLIGLELWTNAVWLVQLGGIVILSKLFLIFLLLHIPHYEKFFLLSILIMSGIISHAPAFIRHFSLWHKKPIDYLPLADEQNQSPP
ncbi:hypothetical protein BegalDRAFT_0219 [Beggiatoa alba B18LD]|uniref:Uncharacterized protein n=1 Tax=Beggiatoa alba B18LD TaxID=395493 RepID=I3CBZ8_9GAMM|nr:hypothetical protein [Beggiatoa alba]EIJ41141.1 hypothetical protein BegalDRAFT_0219 [Beggiatoa alba B18LD]